MRLAVVGIAVGVLALVGLVVLTVALRRGGVAPPPDDLDPLFVPGIATVGVGAALLSPIGPFALVMIAVGGLLMIVALTRMRGGGDRRT